MAELIEDVLETRELLKKLICSHARLIFVQFAKNDSTNNKLLLVCAII